MLESSIVNLVDSPALLEDSTGPFIKIKLCVLLTKKEQFDEKQ
jgi:hypothetical protein